MVWRFLFSREFLVQPKGKIMNLPNESEEQQRQIKIDADIDEVIKVIQGLGLKPDEKATATNPRFRPHRWMRTAVATITTFAIGVFAGFGGAYSLNARNGAGGIQCFGRLKSGVQFR